VTDAMHQTPTPTLHTTTWAVELVLSERGNETHAEARLHTHDDTHLSGHGRARRNPVDPQVPEIGDELAAARALADLSHALLDAAAGDLEAVTHQPATLRL
jgi:hypothetical protein